MCPEPRRTTRREQLCSFLTGTSFGFNSAAYSCPASCPNCKRHHSYPALLLTAQWILAAPIPTRPGSPPAPSPPFWPHHLVLDAASRPLKPPPQPGAGAAPSSLPCGGCTAGSGPHQSRSPPPPHLAQSGAQRSTWALPAPGSWGWTRVPPTHVDARPPADSSGLPPALGAPGSQAEKS